MLSIDECRRLLGNPPMSDEQIAEVRETLAAFATVMIDAIVKDPNLIRTPMKGFQKPNAKTES